MIKPAVIAIYFCLKTNFIKNKKSLLLIDQPKLLTMKMTGQDKPE